jgi:hypothetical protein
MPVARAIIFVLAAAGSALHAQVIVGEARLRPLLQRFEPQPGDIPIRCDVTPTPPALNYSFRFFAGYRLMTQSNQFTGKGHGWTALTRITPRAGDRKPVYLVSAQRLPEIPQVKVTLQSGGGYLLGEGSYDVAWVLLDDRDRVCRKNWRVDVHRSRGESKVNVAMPENTVWDVSLRGARLQRPPAGDAAPVRLSILVNAAPMFFRRTRLSTRDIGTLISAVSSLLERVTTSAVRLVVFNLDQQKELYRNDQFQLRNMPDVAQAMGAVELNTVDYQVLRNRRGHVDLVASLVNQELKRDPLSDFVLFLGPISRYMDGVPADSIERAGPTPRFLNFEIAPFVQADAALPDLIHNAVSRAGGKTVTVRNPGEFAKAIARLER